MAAYLDLRAVELDQDKNAEDGPTKLECGFLFLFIYCCSSSVLERKIPPVRNMEADVHRPSEYSCWPIVLERGKGGTNLVHLLVNDWKQNICLQFGRRK